MTCPVETPGPIRKMKYASAAAVSTVPTAVNGLRSRSRSDARPTITTARALSTMPSATTRLAVAASMPKAVARMVWPKMVNVQ